MPRVELGRGNSQHKPGDGQVNHIPIWEEISKLRNEMPLHGQAKLVEFPRLEQQATDELALAGRRFRCTHDFQKYGRASATSLHL